MRVCTAERARKRDERTEMRVPNLHGSAQFLHSVGEGLRAADVRVCARAASPESCGGVFGGGRLVGTHGSADDARFPNNTEVMGRGGPTASSPAARRRTQLGVGRLTRWFSTGFSHAAASQSGKRSRCLCRAARMNALARSPPSSLGQASFRPSAPTRSGGPSEREGPPGRRSKHQIRLVPLALRRYLAHSRSR